MRPLLLAAALAACASGRQAAPPFAAGGGCAAPEYHALDFWLGEWEVRDPAGSLEGTNRIAADLSGCAVRESWTDAKGVRGESTFFYDRAARRWKQVWITEDGDWKEKAQVESPPGSVRFQGELPRPNGGTVLDRTTLTLLDDGRVRQRIEQSRDGGKTWPASWEGLYARPAAASSCAAAEFGGLDFWLGEWSVDIKGRSPDGTGWQEAHGTNRVRKILGGCAVMESFEADGPGSLWAGNSISQYLPGEKRWRQIWVDDQGSWLAFTGGRTGEGFVLQTDAQGSAAGKTMRMVFHDVRPDHISWRWERSDGAAWTPMLLIEYRRAADGRSR
jgi:hypothetical protein